MNKFIAKLFKLPICGKCNSLKMKPGYYSRGWNNLCEQACGDHGYLCDRCLKITWKQTLEEYKKKLPYWCRAYNDVLD